MPTRAGTERLPPDPEDDVLRMRPRLPRLRGWWRPLALWALWLWMFVLAGVLAGAFGALAGYLAILAAVAFGAWRAGRWCSRQYWGGLREWHG